MPVDAVLDHVAVATESWAEAWPRYVGALGGEWVSGGQNPGFAPAQLSFANGARLEVLQPWHAELNLFLRRFLDRSGPGPHHLTFKVADLRSALAAAQRAGFDPVGVDLTDPGWIEAFLHPRQAVGVVVQLAQAAGSWESPAPEGFPTARPPVPATLTHVVHAVAELEPGVRLFADLLGGRELRRDDAEDGSWRSVTFGWSGPLALRLVVPAPDSPPDTPLRRWLAGRPGRVHHLAFALPAAERGGGSDDGHRGAVPGVTADEHPVEVFEPEQNLGTRLVLSRGTRRGGDGTGSR